jgi:hypothetical protein
VPVGVGLVAGGGAFGGVASFAIKVFQALAPL